MDLSLTSMADQSPKIGFEGKLAEIKKQLALEAKVIFDGWETSKEIQEIILGKPDWLDRHDLPHPGEIDVPATTNHPARR